MASKTITSANAIYTLAVSGIFDAPVALHGFSADDIFTTEAMASAEAIMGVDGVLSAGFVFVPVVQSIALQADSDSNAFFEQWWMTQQNAKEVFEANGVVILPSVQRKWALTRGFLNSFPPMPDAARTLRPRRYGIQWNFVAPAPI